MSGNAGPDANITQAVPFFLVRDMAASIRFYVDGLGFAVTKEWRPDGALRWCWLELGAAALMLQQAGGDGHGPELPPGAPGAGVEIYFICQDALAIYRDLQSRKISARRPFVGNGMWVTSVTDPDGYRLSFESGTDVADETVYSGDD